MKVPENATSGEVTLQVWTNEVGTIGQYTVLPTPYVESMQSDNNAGTGIAEPGNKITIKVRTSVTIRRLFPSALMVRRLLILT